MSILFFKKPTRIAPSGGPLTPSPKDTNGASDACRDAAIPTELSFENVVCNKCAPPCSLQDFLDYLMYVEKRAENLQFYLWMVDYYQRFRSAPKAETDLSPRWTGVVPQKRHNSSFGEYDKKVDLPSTPDFEKHSTDISSVSTWDCEQTEFSDSYTQTLNSIKFSVSPVKQNEKQTSWPPSPSAQPFRAEVDRIINHYIADGSPRQLNLMDSDRQTVIRALKYTTHPSALSLVKRMVDSILRRESHPNFVRWSICNGSTQWTYALRIFAVANITIGFAIAIILTLSRASRYWRIFAALEWWFGITNIIAASQGLCVLLHRMHTRQHHAWETEDLVLDDEAMIKGHDANYTHYENTKSKWPVKMEVFGPANNYDGEAWVELHRRKPWYRKLFERRIPVQEAGLRNMQNRMIRQAEAWAFLITVPLTVAFVAIPKGNLF